MIRGGSWGRYENAGRCAGLGLLLVALAAITALLLASPAGADTPAPPAMPSAGPSTGAPARPAAPQPEADDSEEVRKSKERMKKDLDKAVENYKKTHRSGVLSAFEVTDQYGIPVSAYQVTSDSGGITDVQMKLQSAITESLFTFTKWMISLGCWLVLWALSWSLAAILLKPAMAVSDALYGQTIVQMGLPGLLIAFSGTVAVWHIFFGNRARGWGEIAASTVISALAVSTFAAPPQMLLSPQDGAVGTARDVGIAVFAITMDTQDSLPAGSKADAKKLTRPITDKLVDAFIVQPSMMLSYDQTFDAECTELYSKSRVQQAVFDEAFAKALKRIKDVPSGWDLVPVVGQKIEDVMNERALEYVRDQMFSVEPTEEFEKACVKGDADQAKRTSWDKAGGALFVLFASLLVFCLLLATGFSYLVTQMRLAIEAMLARVALAAGIMPGPGRAWMWERGTAILRLLGLMVVIVVALAVTIQLVTSVLSAPPDVIPGGLTVRFFVVDVVVIAGFGYRKKIANKSKAWAAQARTRVGNTRFGGRAPAQMDTTGKRCRSFVASAAKTALVLGAMAATGGTSSALALGGHGSAALSTRLGARAVRRGGAAVVRGTGRLAAGSARAAAGVGKFGLKYTVGAPVYAPRAARAAQAAVRAAPGRAGQGAAALRERLTQAAVPRVDAARNFTNEYWTNIGGRWAANQVRIHRGLPPRSAPAPRRTRPVSVPRPGPRPAGPPQPRPVPRPAVQRAPRRVPPHPSQPAASARQAALQ
uniref:hypothetical protein n=1 Tax=Streptomyces odonnellii TaxID=1417980 RepID=UPI00062646D6